MAKKKVDQTPPPYNPSPADQELIAYVSGCYDRARSTRRAYEGQWYLNAAFIRGQHWVEWDNHSRTLTAEVAPQRRIRRTWNLVLPKVRARQAKFQKNRAKPEVKPATSDIKDILNSRMTTKALDYSWRNLGLEQTYASALGWSMRTGHGLWWIRWDPSLMARVKYKDPETGEEKVEDAQLGDVAVEPSGAFELLPGDPMIETIGRQPWIIRERTRPLSWIAQRYEAGKFVMSEGKDQGGSGYDRQISQLSPSALSGIGGGGSPEGRDDKDPVSIVKEFFQAPTAKFPKGRQIIWSNGVLLKTQAELPYQMWDMRSNPYPVVDFIDLDTVGQFWNSTLVEQYIGPNRQYNRIRSRLEEHLKLMMSGKILVARQHNVPKSAWNSSMGEIIEYQAHPNIPPPSIWTPPPVVADTWRVLDKLTEEIDTISGIHPSSEGAVGSATSGFQTNLLQEATDAVHAPDVRRHELAIEEAAFKIRRIMKLMYDIPRLISITSSDSQVEAFEFSAAEIDDHADIVVQAGSALPDLKGAKIQMALELRGSGIFGDTADPEVNRKVLNMLDIGDLGSVYATARRDEERARLENIDFEEGRIPDIPLFCDNHDIHSRVHTDELKSSTFKQWTEEAQSGFIDHILWHATYINPPAAAQIAAIYGHEAPMLPQPPAPPVQPGMEQGPPPPAPPPNQGPAASGNNQMIPGGFGPRGSESINPM